MAAGCKLSSRHSRLDDLCQRNKGLSLLALPTPSPVTYDFDEIMGRNDRIEPTMQRHDNSSPRVLGPASAPPSPVSRLPNILAGLSG